MAAKIFLCYRRDDSAGYSGRIGERLTREFGRESFMDVDAIPLGANFVKALHEAVAKCEVLLAVIGPNWLDARDKEGNRRLDDPSDFVRIEIGAALQRDIPVIPILLDAAKVPTARQLPKDIEELHARQGLDVRLASFDSDIDRLFRGLKAQIGLGAPPLDDKDRMLAERRRILKVNATVIAIGGLVGLLSFFPVASNWYSFMSHSPFVVETWVFIIIVGGLWCTLLIFVAFQVDKLRRWLTGE